MALENRLPVPDSLMPEMLEYLKITEDPNRSTTGQASFTNPNTLVSYTTLGSPYDGQGKEGLALLLFNESPPLLKTYIYSDSDYTEMKDVINDLNIKVSEDIPITESVTLVPSTVITGQTKPTFKGLSVVNQAPTEEGDLLAVVDGGNGYYLAEDGTIAGPTGSKTFTQKSGDDIFLYISFQSISTALVDALITNAGAGSATYVLPGGDTLEAYVEYNTVGTQDGYIRFRAGTTGNLYLDKAFYINKTALNIESFTESQMLDLARAGYFDGIKDYDEVITSVGKNIYDFTNIESGDIESATGVKIVDATRVRTKEPIPVVGGQSIVINNGLFQGIFSYDGGGNLLEPYQIVGGGGVSYTLHADTKYIEARSLSVLTEEQRKTIQIEYNTVSTVVELHKKSTQRLSGRGNEQFADTESSIIVGKVVLDGSLPWTSFLSSTAHYRIIDNTLDIGGSVDVGDRLATLAYSDNEGILQTNGSNYTSVSGDPSVFYYVSGNYPILYLEFSYVDAFAGVGAGLATLQDCKDYLNAYPVTIYPKLLSPIERTDSEVLTVYEDGSINVAYAPTELILKEASNTRAQSIFSDTEAIGRITNRLPDNRTEYLMVSSDWVDDTGTSGFWLYDIPMNVTSDDFGILAYFEDDVDSGKTAVLKPNGAKTHDGYIRVKAYSQPSDGIRVQVVGVK